MKSNRVDVTWPFDPRQLHDLASTGTVQFEEPAPRADEYNKLAKALEKFPKSHLRVYSYGAGREFGALEFLDHFPKLRRFVCDLGGLSNLDGLGRLPAALEALSIGQLNRKGVSLMPVTRFTKLRELGLAAPIADLDSALASLPGLNDLSLLGFNLPDLGALLPLKKLRRLRLVFGGTTNLSLLPKIGRLERLDLQMNRGLSDVSIIGELESLKSLLIQKQPRVRELPPLKRLRRLERVYLGAMRGITDLSPLTKVRTLKDVVIVSAGHMQEKDFECLKRLPRGCRVRMGSASKRLNDAVDAMLRREMSQWWGY